MTDPVKIPLTNGGFTVIDAEDLPLVGQYSWYSARPGRGLVYAQTNIRVPERERWTTTQLHRLLYPGCLVDHIDGNGLNNIKGNLRKCKHQENGWNRRKLKATSSRYKGVSLHVTRRNGRTYRYWVARIRLDDRLLRLGTFGFDREPVAALAYDDAARRLFGQFARVNFPKEGEQCSLSA